MHMLSAERVDAVDRLDVVLAALEVGNDYQFVAPPGLSAVAIYLPQRDAVVALTSAHAPLFRDGVEETAKSLAADVVLLRTCIVDALPVVSADIALAAPPCAAWVENDLSLWSGSGSLWLVPQGFGPSVQISADGFSVALLPPYETLDERAIGVALAAQAFVAPRALAEVL